MAWPRRSGSSFPAGVAELATLSIGVIVLNQIVGPPLLKWAITRVGESHTRADSPAFDGVRDAIIFGVEGQSLALARQFESQEWNVQMVTCQEETLAERRRMARRASNYFRRSSATRWRELDMGKTESVVLMLSDEENYAICELIYEQFGVENVIVRLEDRKNFDKFHDLGALVVEPGTAMVSLLDQFVRSPFAATLLLGMDPEEEFAEFEMHNPDLAGIAIRDIHFPHDVLILAISRARTPSALSWLYAA